METLYDLLDMYPNRPRKLLSRWHDARLALANAGEQFVLTDRQRGSLQDLALREAERWEQVCYEAVFAPSLLGRSS